VFTAYEIVTWPPHHKDERFARLIGAMECWTDHETGMIPLEWHFELNPHRRRYLRNIHGVPLIWPETFCGTFDRAELITLAAPWYAATDADTNEQIVTNALLAANAALASN
jgi:hypothetical protein